MNSNVLNQIRGRRHLLHCNRESRRYATSSISAEKAMYSTVEGKGINACISAWCFPQKPSFLSKQRRLTNEGHYSSKNTVIEMQKQNISVSQKLVMHACLLYMDHTMYIQRYILVQSTNVLHSETCYVHVSNLKGFMADHGVKQAVWQLTFLQNTFFNLQ